MHFDPHNPDELYTVDSSRGLTKVNVRTGEVRLLAPSHDKTGKFPYMNFVNDLIVLSNGSVFFTDSSKKFGRVHNRMEVLECRANGQLLHYNPTDNSVGVIAEDLFFPNGICISHDGQSLLVVELTRARILRYVTGLAKYGNMQLQCGISLQAHKRIFPPPRRRVCLWVLDFI